MDPSTIAASEVKKEIINLAKRAIASPTFWLWFGFNEVTICPIKCWKCSQVAMLRLHIIRHVELPTPKYSGRVNCDNCKEELYRDGSDGYVSKDGAKEHCLDAFVKIYEFKVNAMADGEASVYLDILKSKTG